MAANSLPWYDYELAAKGQDRDLAYSMFKKNKSDERWQNYKRVRNEFVNLIKLKKCKYFTDMIDTNLKDPIQMWKTLKMLINTKIHESNYSKGIDFQINGEVKHIKNNKEIAEQFNKYFVNSIQSIVETIPNTIPFECETQTESTFSEFTLLNLKDIDCWYDDDRHDEGAEVATAEPCLNCTCSRGALLCYLRVCTKLPNPPPPGCILLHRYRTCCPELICADIPGGGNGLEARSEPDELDLMPFDRAIMGNACVANGSIYAPGSAMDSSSLCEYCYCLAGRQTCVQPRCLLPVDGCTPMFEPISCCPVRYNCSKTLLLEIKTTSSTTAKPKEVEVRGGCLVDGILYPEGGKVLGVGHSVCDNCYCLRSILRCEPLSCAPPLLGCTPVIKSGECCAASYNCSGTIEIEPKPNYGQYPTVSKEYAKLRKEVQQKRTPSKHSYQQAVVTENTNMPYYVIAESSLDAVPPRTQHRSPGMFGTTRHFTGISFNPSTSKPYYYNPGLSRSETRHPNPEKSFPGYYSATTNYEFQNTNYKRPYSTTIGPKATTSKTPNTITTTSYKEQEKLQSTDLFGFSDDTLFSFVESLLDERLNRKVDTETNEIIENTTEGPVTTEMSDVTQSTAAIDEITTASRSPYENLVESTSLEISTEHEENNLTTTEDLTTVNNKSNNPYPVTLKTVLNSTDCKHSNESEAAEHRHQSNIIDSTTIISIDANEINKLVDKKGFADSMTTTESDELSSTESTTEDDVTEVDLISKVKVSSVTYRNVPNIPPEIEAILNITKQKNDDYEFDYNESSLPPSLPNLHIIPFEAADAVDPKKDMSEEDPYSKEKQATNLYGFSNLFSPPSETEGGFIPKEPVNLENLYENAVTIPTFTTASKITEVSCFSEGTEIQHDQSVHSESACITCTCFYGNIVCQKAPCPVPKPGCRKSSVQDLTLCCPNYVCDDEAPTVVLDRLDGTNAQEVVTVAEGVRTPDPFRDVIRTEPAPNLQSLIGDILPLLNRKTTPISQSTVEKTTQTITSLLPPSTKTNQTENDDGLSLDKVLQLLLGNNEEKTEITTTIKQTPTPIYLNPTTLDHITTSVPSITRTSNLQELSATDYYIKEKERLNGHISKRPNENEIKIKPGVGPLKLAGCNIYGRMYRVGRIISELSGPCLECKCTEIGVQCRALKC